MYGQILKSNNIARGILFRDHLLVFKPISSLLKSSNYNKYTSNNNTTRCQSTKIDDGFYKVADSSKKPDMYSFKSSTAQNIDQKGSSSVVVIGEVIDHAIDMRAIRPGDTIDVPYEVTISDGFRDFWQSAFYSYDRIQTSTPFARSLGLQDQIIPFHLMLFLASSMSHADHAKTHIGYGKAKYHWPAFAGDTFKKRFIIQSLRTTSDQLHSIFTIECQLINQRNVVLFDCELYVLFPFKVPPSDVIVHSSLDLKHNNSLLKHLIRQVEVLQERGSQTLTSMRPGQLILHTLTRPISPTHCMQLATLARLTHERHFNTRLFRNEELYVPSGLVVALTCSLSSRDLHEALHEEILQCSFPNNLSPGDTVGALTYIQALEEHVSGDIEALTIRTIGVKNYDVHRKLTNQALPSELFTAPLNKLHTKELEELIRKSYPELSRMIVCIADRKLYRQAPKQAPFLL